MESHKRLKTGTEVLTGNEERPADIVLRFHFQAFGCLSGDFSGRDWQKEGLKAEAFNPF
jgi:hypothetical protein